MLDTIFEFGKEVMWFMITTHLFIKSVQYFRYRTEEYVYTFRLKIKDIKRKSQLKRGLYPLRLNTCIKLLDNKYIWVKNLQNQDLREVSFSSSQLYNIPKKLRNMNGSDLRGCYLVGEDLAGLDFTGADLRGAKFSSLTTVAGCTFKGTKMYIDQISSLKLTGLQIMGMKLSKRPSTLD